MAGQGGGLVDQQRAQRQARQRAEVPGRRPDRRQPAGIDAVQFERDVASGRYAAVVAGTAVALLVLGYLAIYLLVFLPRGTVG